MISIDDMPGWDKYKPNVISDTNITRDVETFRLGGNAVTTGIFDMNGKYVGLTEQGLPQERYIIRKKVEGRTLFVPYKKK